MSSMEARQSETGTHLSIAHNLHSHSTKEQRMTQTRDLMQLFSLDLAHCPRLEREEEYVLTRRTRSAWLHLLTSLKAQHDLLAALLGTRHLPSSYEALSEPEMLRLLQQVQVRIDQAETYEAGPHLTSLRTWLARMREDLARFRDCRNEMLRRNLRLVVLLARRYQHRSLSLLDLVQEGALGLMRAIEKFDPERRVTFASYAVWWIRHAFSRALTARGENICSADAPLREGEDGSLTELVAAPETSSPEIAVLTMDTAKGLHHALARLPGQEADILRLRFGLVESNTYTLEEVSRRLGLNREQVRLREQRALARLKTYLQRSVEAV